MRKVLTILLAVLVVLNTAFIFYQSLQDAEASANTSGAVSDIVADVVVPDLPQRPVEEQESVMEEIQKWTRTAAHAIEFAGLGFFFCAFVLILQLAKVIPLPYKLGTALLFSVSVALFDETLQLFVDGRAFELKDIGVDTLGASFGIACAFALVFLVELLQKRKSQN